MVREKATLARPDARDEFVASYWRDRYALQAHLTPRVRAQASDAPPGARLTPSVCV